MGTLKFREVLLTSLAGTGPHKARVMVVINIIVLIICRPSKILAVFTITGFTATLVWSHFNFNAMFLLTVSHPSYFQAKSTDFLCPYTAHCFALCHCCDFDACDCEMTCPDNCTCYHDQR